MSRKVGLVLFLVSMFLLGTSTWAPEYELLDVQKSYAPIETDNGNGTWDFALDGTHRNDNKQGVSTLICINESQLFLLFSLAVSLSQVFR